MGVTIGIDIGGSTTKAVAIDRHGRRRLSSKHATDSSSSETIVSGAAAAANEVMRKGEQPLVVGVAVPGAVDPERGTVRYAVNLNLGSDEIALGPSLSETLGGVKIRVENDVLAAAYGAYHHLAGEGRRVETLVYLNIGTGISAGVVISGRIHRGRHGLAGEIGHTIVQPGGPLCRCGLSGCLEAVAAGPAIDRAWRLLGGDPQTDPFMAATKGDPAGTALAGTVGSVLARGLHTLLMTYDPDCIVLGGGATAGGAAFMAAIDEALVELTCRSRLGSTLVREELLIHLPPDEMPGAIGAALLARASMS